MKTPLYLLLTLLVELKWVHGANVTLSPATATAATSKPGKCPKSEPLQLVVCFERCTQDSECDGNRKCCETSCGGLQCQIPDDKPGLCPEHNNATSCDPAVHCSHDSKCDGVLKCCPTGCQWSSCQNPV